MDQRVAKINRQTKETQINLELNLDGSGQYEIETGIGFFDHMLSHLARHGLMDISLKAAGDLHVDAHHTVEDVAICLGQALEKSLGDKKGILRFGSATVPMEDSLAQVAIDLCGRPCCAYRVSYPGEKVGQFDIELVEEFMRAFSNNARFNLHINVPYGTNNHHIAEAVFKSLGRALGQAVQRSDRIQDIPSTKGIL